MVRPSKITSCPQRTKTQSTKKVGSYTDFKCDRVDCDDEYIGESARNFEERLKEHLKAPSPIYDHHNTSGHDVTIDNFTILGRGPQPLKDHKRSSVH